MRESLSHTSWETSTREFGEEHSADILFRLGVTQIPKSQDLGDFLSLPTVSH